MEISRRITEGLRRTQTIRYAELKQLIEERREREQLLWFKHLKEIARIGIADAALFDLKTGTVNGAGGNLVIDESLLPQLAFIREGQFSETKGKPTLKLIGSVELTGSPAKSQGGKAHVVKTQGIRGTDIIRTFLNNEKVPDPKAYFTQIAWESSAFLPCYFHLSQAGLKLVEAISAIEKEHSTTQAKAKLLERLKSDNALRVSMPSNANSNGQRKLAARKALISKKARADVQGRELGDILDMIRTLSKNDLPVSHLRQFLLEVFNKHFARQDTSINDKIRRAICYVDYLHYRKEEDAE